VAKLCESLRGRRYACSLAAYRRAYESCTSPQDHAPLPMFPPEVVRADTYNAQRPLPSAHRVPFLTTAAGVGPAEGVPMDLNDFLARYVSSGTSSNGSSERRSPPHVLIDDETQASDRTLDEAHGTISRAASRGQRLWIAALLPRMAYPPWWPQSAVSIPSYEHLLVGCGASSVGMHRDRYVDQQRPVAPGCERLMCTYISLARGVKHVVLLPPTPTGAALAELLGGDGCDEPDGRSTSASRRFPARPPPATLERVVSAGGFWFDHGARSLDPHEEQPAVCLFLPAGWWHWLVADADFHVAWSASFFPEADRESHTRRG
jgi:hypothetical protein